MDSMLKRLCDAAEAYLETSAEKGHQYFLTLEKRRELRQSVRDARDEIEAPGIWPASKLPTCPKCGWPPMVDEENPDEHGDAPIVCAC